MFYGLATNKVRVPGYRFTHTLCDIETLNQRALNEAFYDVTAISFHAYPYLQDKYAVMGCAAAWARATAHGGEQQADGARGPGQDQIAIPGA